MNTKISQVFFDYGEFEDSKGLEPDNKLEGCYVSLPVQPASSVGVDEGKRRVHVQYAVGE